MNNLDIISLIILLIFAITGYKKGVVKSGIAWMKVILSLIATNLIMSFFREKLQSFTYLENIVSLVRNFFIKSFPPLSFIDESFIDFYISFTLIFLAMLFILSVIFLGTEISRSKKIKTIDRLMGFVLSILLYSIIYMYLLFLFDKVPDVILKYEWKEYLSESIFFRFYYIYNIFMIFN